MVRHGMLSRGCENCRKRKIKCDQARPDCSQCLKGGWKCPQYGDTLERIFQRRGPSDFGEGQNLAPLMPMGRSSSSFPKQSRLSSTNYICGSSFVTKTTTVSSEHHDLSFCAPLERGIIHPINSRAIEFFLASQIFHQPDIIRGYYEYLPALTRYATVDKRLFNSLSAVALAAYAYNFRHATILKKARWYYGQALQCVNNALSSINESVQDSTIISILLLSTFENMTCDDRKSFRNTEAHMIGVMAILNMRGRSQFEPRHRLQIFQHMCTCLHLSSLIHSIRIPRQLRILRAHAAEFLDTDDPAWKLSGIMAKLAKFREDVKTKVIRNRSDIVQSALEIDQDLTLLEDQMPYQWHFQTVSLPTKCHLVFDTYYHIYPDLWVACTWNNLRTCRLLLHKEICKQLLKVSHTGFVAEGSVYQNSKMILQQIIDEICATIPQFCDNLSSLADSKAHLAKYRNTIPANAAGYFLMWPLLNMSSIIDSEIQREWVVHWTCYIGRKSGIQQAFVVADLLRTKQEFTI
ncbi:putative C6 transcription factor [Talaromyces proteolyticus]|uniref:C6 transcription factor n=1 Tax=Talaromyces proteolyticus TaxID=1131652 RepID=A0AAD4KHP8_9EURO|nr:putative C6 transcription factor [Talaromyces proteolyticus]KAH8688720.1 putative C6 transcription factor [Talaromyces proteolyticus]